MNVRVISVTTLDGTNQDGPGTLYDGITGFLGFVPEIQIGQRMWIYYISGIGSRIHSTKVKGHTFDPQTATHIVTTKNSIYKLLELDYGQNRKKRITSTLYMLDPLGRKFQEGNSDPDGHLLSYGRYPTKIFPSDLPPWYVYGYMYKRHGFMSAKGVKHLLYKPNYTFNHLWKYDTLFISYDKPITPTIAESGFEWYEGYNHCIGGSLILEFVDAAEQYSEYDVSDIRAEFRKKEEWYKEKYGG